MSPDGIVRNHFLASAVVTSCQFVADVRRSNQPRPSFAPLFLFRRCLGFQWDWNKTLMVHCLTLFYQDPLRHWPSGESLKYFRGIFAFHFIEPQFVRGVLSILWGYRGGWETLQLLWRGFSWHCAVEDIQVSEDYLFLPGWDPVRGIPSKGILLH